MELEPEAQLVAALKSAYDGMMQRKDWSDEAYATHIEPLLAGLTEDDRHALSSTIWHEESQLGDQERGSRLYTYILLARHIHPWTTGS